MEHETNFSRLEQTIEKLLASFNTIKQANVTLEASLRQRNQEVNELRETVTRLEEEKKQIHRRVTGLIGSIEEWEKHHSGMPEADEARQRILPGA